MAICAWLGMLTLAQLLATSLLAGLVSVFFKAAFQAYIPLVAHERGAGRRKFQASGERGVCDGKRPGNRRRNSSSPRYRGGRRTRCCKLCRVGRLPDRHPPHRPGLDVIEAKARTRQGDHGGAEIPRRDPYLLPLAAFASTLGLGVSSTDSLMIVFYVRTLGVTSSVTGIVLGLIGAGGLFGAVISTRLVRRYGSARAMLICRVLLTFALLLPLSTRGIGLIFSVGWFVVTAGIISGNIISLSFRQARCPAQMLGRISASYYTMTYSFMALGAVLGGTLGTLIGVRTALWVTCGIVASASSILFFSPIRKITDLPEPAMLG